MTELRVCDKGAGGFPRAGYLRRGRAGVVICPADASRALGLLPCPRRSVLGKPVPAWCCGAPGLDAGRRAWDHAALLLGLHISSGGLCRSADAGVEFVTQPYPASARICPLACGTFIVVALGTRKPRLGRPVSQAMVLGLLDIPEPSLRQGLRLDLVVILPCMWPACFV